MNVSNLKLVAPVGSGPVIRSDQGAGAGADRDFIVFKKGGAEVFSVDKNGLPDPGGGDAKRKVPVPYGDVVADSDLIEPFLNKFVKGVTITGIKLAVDTATADGTTNRQTITVKRGSDGATVAEYQTPAENPGLAQNIWTDMGAITNATLAAGDYLYAAFTKTAGGLALSGLTFEIEYQHAE
ncbi:hypothetical protein LLH00_06005 [bacterium]|nr:hypothetical protein [bacterium]